MRPILPTCPMMRPMRTVFASTYRTRMQMPVYSDKSIGMLKFYVITQQQVASDNKNSPVSRSPLVMQKDQYPNDICIPAKADATDIRMQNRSHNLPSRTHTTECRQQTREVHESNTPLFINVQHAEANPSTPALETKYRSNFPPNF